MELIMPQNNIDFDFRSARTSPHTSPPMTPRRFGESYFSAPTSPSRVAGLYREYADEISKMGVRKESLSEFDFQFCSEILLHDTLCSADELFDGGKIRPLKSPLKKAVICEELKASAIILSPLEKVEYSRIPEQRRGRAMNSPMSHSSRRATRSVSPLREGGTTPQKGEQQPKLSSSSSSVFRKWKLKDFLLFRSKSEGHTSDKYPLKKFSVSKKNQDYGKSTSFLSVDSFGSSEGGMRKKTQMSAHEEHYTKNKAASDSLKKKTYLPYKQGIFGRLF